MAVAMYVMCFLNADQAYRGHVAGSNSEHLEAASHACVPYFRDIANLGMVIRGRCLACRKEYVARFGGSFELAIAVDEETMEARFVGVVCDECAKLPVEIKSDALRARFGPTRVN